MSRLKWTYQDAAHLQETVKVLSTRAGAGTNVDARVAHSQIHIQLIHIAHVEGDVMLAEHVTTLLCVRHVFWPQLQPIVHAISQDLSHQGTEVPRAGANVQKRHAGLQGHQGLQRPRIDVRS